MTLTVRDCDSACHLGWVQVSPKPKIHPPTITQAAFTPQTDQKVLNNAPQSYMTGIKGMRT